MGELSSKMLSQQKPTAALLGQGLGLLLSWPFIPPLNQQLVPETWSPRAGLCLGERNWIFLRAYWMESKNWQWGTDHRVSRLQASVALRSSVLALCHLPPPNSQNWGPENCSMFEETRKHFL